METTDVIPLLEDLSDNIEELEEVLAPLLNNNLSDITSKLPLLDRAKLHVLVTYGIESIIFAYLKLNGVNAKEHPVFTELSRVKQYFEKIKEAENNGPAKRENMQLDKDAAARFIKSALAGNDEYDRQRAERVDKEKENARKKFEALSDQVGATQRFKQASKKRKQDDSESPVDAESTTLTSIPTSPKSPVNSGVVQLPGTAQSELAENKHKKKKKKSKKSSSSGTHHTKQPEPSVQSQELSKSWQAKFDALLKESGEKERNSGQEKG